MQALYKDVKQTHAVWAVSHAGHCLPQSQSPWYGNQHIYNLEDQVQHKIAFILDYVPKDANITLIGHSIGCYIILKVLEAFEANGEMNIVRNFLLFPTIERMRTSPNGHRLWPILCYFRWLVVLLAALVHCLPSNVKTTMADWYFRGKGVPDYSISASVELVHPKIVQNVLWMAYHELQQVLSPDINVITRHKETIVFYYGASDGWCPKSYRTELLAEVDGLRSYLCEDEYLHAFVLKSHNVEGLSMKISTWICS
ncbi:hypothetical protein SK128_015246 [Halocaridina rubra]|uniref:Lipid droplet-associated hydrolase n=1 Tax=Halocaridina rubra TaxID=373956 RepID=A0AAN8WZH2_HALRR